MLNISIITDVLEQEMGDNRRGFQLSECKLKYGMQSLYLWSGLSLTEHYVRASTHYTDSVSEVLTLWSFNFFFFFCKY